MTQLRLFPEKIEVACRKCGSSFELAPGFSASERACECLVCPVCRAPGPALDDVELDEAGSVGRAECRPSEEYRLLACFRPDGTELGPANDGAPREVRELARMLWRLADG